MRTDDMNTASETNGMQALTILSLLSSEKHTGPGVAALQQACLLRDAGHRVLFGCFDRGPLAEMARHRGMATVRNLSLPRKGEFWRLPADVRRLRQTLADEGVDLLLAHRTPEMIVSALAARGKLPLLRLWHDGTGAEPGWLLKTLWKRWRIRAVATSRAGARAAGEAARDPSSNDLLIAPGAVDLERFRPGVDGSAIRAELNFHAHEVVVGLSARWKEDRGLEDFLEAFAAALRRSSALRAVLVGRGELRPALERRIASLGMAHAVRLFQAEERFVPALAALDLGVLMQPGSDGTARAALEMMAMEKPMAVMRRGSLADLAGEEEAAVRLCDSGEELSRALVELAADPEARRSLGLRGRKQIEERHTPERLRETLSRLAVRAAAERWHEIPFGAASFAGG